MGKLMVGLALAVVVALAGVTGWIGDAREWATARVDDIGGNAEDAVQRAQSRCRTAECRRLVSAIERHCTEKSAASRLAAERAANDFDGVMMVAYGYYGYEDYERDLDMLDGLTERLANSNCGRGSR